MFKQQYSLISEVPPTYIRDSIKHKVSEVGRNRRHKICLDLKNIINHKMNIIDRTLKTRKIPKYPKCREFTTYACHIKR